MNTSTVENSVDLELISKIAGFINEIGISCQRGAVPENTFLPGVEIVAGRLVFDEARLIYPGDLLHEAGHLAVLLPADRQLAGGSEHLSGDLQEGGAEMAAIAWSWAAKEYLGLPHELLFHSGGYKDGSESLIDCFSNPQQSGPGVPLLQWFGMTTGFSRENASDEFTYPQMRFWLRQPVA